MKSSQAFESWPKNLGDQGVLLYPEGTRFTKRKQEIALKRLAKTHPDLAEIAATFKHCLPPKPGGALGLLDTAPNADVLIVAHRGLEGLANATRLAQRHRGRCADSDSNLACQRRRDPARGSAEALAL